MKTLYLIMTLVLFFIGAHHWLEGRIDDSAWYLALASINYTIHKTHE